MKRSRKAIVYNWHRINCKYPLFPLRSKNYSSTTYNLLKFAICFLYRSAESSPFCAVLILANIDMTLVYRASVFVFVSYSVTASIMMWPYNLPRRFTLLLWVLLFISEWSNSSCLSGYKEEMLVLRDNLINVASKKHITISEWNISTYLRFVRYLIKHCSYLIYFCAQCIKLCRVESIIGRKSRKLPPKTEMKETGGAVQHVPTYSATLPAGGPLWAIRTNLFKSAI